MKVGEPTERDIGADSLRGLAFEGPRSLAVAYKGTKLGCGCGSRVRGSLDVVVERKVEIKCVNELLPVHDAQLLTYMRLGGFEVGLLMNFHVAVFKQGLRRKVL